MQAADNQIGNFEFLKDHDPIFLQLASMAEAVFARDPNTTLIKLRQLGEAFARDMAARCGITFDEQAKQADLLYRLNRQVGLDNEVRELFHTLRIEGNKATHGFHTQHREAMNGLKLARVLAIWFHRTFGPNGDKFKPGPFVPPKDPSLCLRELQKQIEQLKASLTDANQEIESSHELAELVAREKKEFEVLAEKMDEDARTFEALASENEAKLANMQADYEKQLQALRDQLDAKAVRAATKNARKASGQVDLNEELTRILIDQQLIAAGWEADTQELTYSKGARPEPRKNKAIAEWPTVGRQSADYVLFSGMTPIAVVEAKRENVNVAGKIPQAERYAAGFRIEGDHYAAWRLAGQNRAWTDGDSGTFQIPFVYSCNGKPFVKQLKEKSGTWFRDVRASANLKKPLQGFHSPEGLLDRLARSKTEAHDALRNEGFAYLKLRDYQEKAIRKVEEGLEAGKTECLLAMATGTGKTRTIIGLMYRLLKAERFKRILFLVDRNTLGTQAQDFFDEAPLEQNSPLSKIYNIAELGDMAPEAETRIQVATVQAMVKRLFRSDNSLCVDEFDCIIVDEAHRGYTLDQEMTDGEIEFRDQAQYLSTYRRVLDWFDAVKIGMTATPAKHTTDIFGKPVYTYTYREAVADDWLRDHEPPIRYRTYLSENGIQFEKGETVEVVNMKSGEVDTAELEDEQNFEIDSFNRRVIADDFNRVICEALAEELDPFGEEKVLIFCVTDLHADKVKTQLDKQFKKLYGEDYNEKAVRKITGASDQVDKLIRRFKRERYPSIAITVDLLTTGVDVPRICHLVFLRRVRSRILYEQMVGRATRKCDEIGKTEFKIYDPVDLYAALDEVSTMKPIVKNPNISLDQLIQELLNPDCHAALADAEHSHADDVLDQINQKVLRVLRKAHKKAERNDKVRDKLNELEGIWGVEPAELHRHFHEIGPEKAAEFLRTHAGFVQQLDDVKTLIGTDSHPIISHHEDELIGKEQNFGVHERPGDYLQEFSEFVKSHLNESIALSTVVNRPKDLTRKQLKEVRLYLDQNGFPESSLKAAWRGETNQEIAAGIVGYIRQAAIGEALIPFDRRVEAAMEKIHSMRHWTTVQRKWLDRLAKQLNYEMVLDQQTVNDIFSNDGGANRLNIILHKQLEPVLETLSASLWNEAV
ncbi:type I restriction-modification system endonuclease [Tichowtungia aerotolerans]|uniref:Type I restriction-modification system endonuclease n=1 Tax=Tichowtungia aerotolerans TaxID=2697043 RepID=A0A6P1MCQ0_9BACT|nr:type I restriction-modification system endonuclease [Tichowtungia aerotolerans]